ncbi:MAG: type II secretion system F family protein, partial [Planctomycetota bacterium]|nr:type II secretion system F family protein [Planctomycetota bacterium]
PLSQALAAHVSDVTPEELAIVEAGETSGRLDQNLDRLARLREVRQVETKRFWTSITYPLIVFHVAALLIPWTQTMMNEGFAGFTIGVWLARVLFILVPVYGAVILWHVMSRSPVWRRRQRALVEALPGFGSAARHRRRAVFTSVLGAAYEAGVPLLRSTELAGNAARVAKREQIVAKIGDGQPLAVSVAGAGILKPGTISLLATAEQAGELGPALDRVAAEETLAANEILTRSLLAAGKIVYFLVAAWIVYFVFTFYANYFSGLGL